MEIKKSQNAQLEDKRITFFLLGLLLAFSLLFVGLQYSNGPQGDDDAAQDMAEAAAAAPASKAITQQVKAAEKAENAPQKISTTTSQLVIGDGSGVVDGANVKEAAPETAVDNSNPNALAEAPIVFTVVQKIPEFPGGWSAYMQWLTKNLKYPPAAQKNKIQGTVVVSFIVNKDGSVANVRVSTSVDPLLDNEALRVMKMMPKWKPGIDKNKVCRTMIAVPVVFAL